MYRVACTRKEASCIIGNLVTGLVPTCDKCRGLPDDCLSILTEQGLNLKGLLLAEIVGTSAYTGKPVRFKLTDYGFEFWGDFKELTLIRKARCLYFGAVHPAKEG